MDTIINQLSQIEDSAASVMEDANLQKKTIAQEMSDKTAAFDQEQEAEIAQQIEALRADMEVKMNAKLEQQHGHAASVLLQMELNYEEHHEEYARRLFRQIIKE